MKRTKPNIAYKLDEAGNRIEPGINLTERVPPQMYTSVHQWKPVQPERFAQLMHHYSTQDENLDDFLNGLMSTKSFHLDATATATIWYTVKEEGSPVSSPVLMTMSYSNGKVLCFASTTYGLEAFAGSLPCTNPQG